MRKTTIIPTDIIQNKIILRGQKVMLDRDLAELYDVETKTINQAVKRNPERFPKDFMFQLTKAEHKALRSHFVTLKRGQHSKYRPYAFTEHGILMLSSVLNSPRAIHVNITIMRVFTQLRNLLASHRELKQKIEIMEKKYDSQFRIVFEAIKRLIEEPPKKKYPIGFHAKP